MPYGISWNKIINYLIYLYQKISSLSFLVPRPSGLVLSASTFPLVTLPSFCHPHYLWVHPFKILANFHNFQPLPPLVGIQLHSSSGIHKAKVAGYTACRQEPNQYWDTAQVGALSAPLTYRIIYCIVPNSTIKFWTLLAKGHSTYKASNFPFINSLKILWCATNRDMLLLATLRYRK